MGKKEKYLRHIVDNLIELTSYSNKLECFEIPLYDFDGFPVYLQFNLTFLERNIKNINHDVIYPQILGKYLTDYWGISSDDFSKDIFRQYVLDLGKKLPILKQYIDDNIYEKMVLNIKHT